MLMIRAMWGHERNVDEHGYDAVEKRNVALANDEKIFFLGSYC